jgi:hypothetical protein
MHSVICCWLYILIFQLNTFIIRILLGVMGLWDIFVAEFKSGMLGLYAGWLAIPTMIAVLSASVIGLVIHWNLILSIVGLAIFVFLALLELPLLTNWVNSGSMTDTFLKFVRYPACKAFFHTAFAILYWLTLPSIISVHMIAAGFLSLTAVMNLSATLKRESSIERYHICAILMFLVNSREAKESVRLDNTNSQKAIKNETVVLSTTIIYKRKWYSTGQFERNPAKDASVIDVEEIGI